MMLLKYKYKQG